MFEIKNKTDKRHQIKLSQVQSNDVVHAEVDFRSSGRSFPGFQKHVGVKTREIKVNIVAKGTSAAHRSRSLRNP